MLIDTLEVEIQSNYTKHKTQWTFDFLKHNSIKTFADLDKEDQNGQVFSEL